MNRSQLAHCFAAWSALALSVIAQSSAVRAATITTLHTFGTGTDGQYPSTVIVNGAVLYGIAPDGGTTNDGIIYRINSNGTGYQILHTFGGTDGFFPNGLTLVGTTLYGLTASGGTNGVGGTLFRMNTDGTNFQVLYRFLPSASEGGNPLVIGSTIYGTTSDTIFSINTNGTSYRNLVNVASSNTLTIFNSVIYGTTQNAPSSIFRVNLDGTGLQTLHSFPFGTSTYASVIPVGTALYGSTWAGGALNQGSLFRINDDGTGFQTLHSFPANSSDGYLVDNPPLLVGSTLYGTTSASSAYSTSSGTMFRMNLDGTGYQTINNTINFVDPGNLTLGGTTIYGTTHVNGPLGTLFSYGPVPIPEPSAIALAACSVIALGLKQLRARKHPISVGTSGQA